MQSVVRLHCRVLRCLIAECCDASPLCCDLKHSSSFKKKSAMPLQEPVACHSIKSHMTSAVFSTFFSVCLTFCTALSSDRLSHYQRDLNKYDRSVAMTQAVAGFLSPHSRHHLMGAPLRLEQVMVPSLVIIGLPCHSATHSADVLKSGCTHDNQFSVEKQEQNLQTKKVLFLHLWHFSCTGNQG